MYGDMMLDSGFMCRSTNGAAIDGIKECVHLDTLGQDARDNSGNRLTQVWTHGENIASGSHSLHATVSFSAGGLTF